MISEFHLAPFIYVCSLQRRMFCRISETHMHLHTNTQLPVGKINKFSLTKCEDGVFGSCFVSSVPGSPFPAFGALQPLSWPVTPTLPGVMGWHGVHSTEKQVANCFSTTPVMVRVFPASSYKLLMHLEGQTTKRSGEKFTTDLHRGRFKAI